MSAAPEVTSDNFESEVIESSIPVVVDFWAEWCGPCKMLGPVIDQISEEYAGKVKIFKLNVEGEAAIASKYGVSSIPTLLMFKGGQVVDRTVGFQQKSAIASKIDALL